ncbi:MAG: 50S ribosomal protein L4 [Bacteroidales bacterium]|nr:50S ribosomal protein L4 [Bacteroidales bacterium]
MDLKVYNIEGKEVGRTVKVDETVFNVQPNPHVIYLDVKRILAEKRQGTHKTKERSEITGSTKKLYRQKGTGNARRGDIKSPLLIGGGRIFGPKPRNYSIKVNKKVSILARKIALSEKTRENAIRIIDYIHFENYKTQQAVAFLKNFDSYEKKSLWVLDEWNNNVYLSTRNLQNVKVISASDLNTYDILNAEILFISEKSLEIIHALWGSSQEEKTLNV